MVLKGSPTGPLLFTSKVKKWTKGMKVDDHTKVYFQVKISGLNYMEFHMDRIGRS